MKKILGFSLVELMISLIVISVVTAAFAPIVTKKLKTSDMSIGSGASEYIYDESICNSSIENCSVCIKDECIKCKAGYYLNTTGACESCLENCASCNNNSKCEKCNSGYLIKDSNTKCEKIECKEGCINCDLTSGCIECSKGYYLNTTTKNCDKCKTGCLKCSDANTCSDCDSKYFKNGSSCTACHKGCLGCTSASNCTMCEDKCEICLSDKGCVRCIQGYYWNGTQCSACKEQNKYYAINASLTMYRFNAGDECGPQLPPNVYICKAGGAACSYGSTLPTCWVSGNATNEKTASSCATWQTYTNYAGCRRTVCNWYAANVIQQYYADWQLPTDAQAKAIAAILDSSKATYTALQLVQEYGTEWEGVSTVSGGAGSETCKNAGSFSNNCFIAHYKLQHPTFVSIHATYGRSVELQLSPRDAYMTGSVRLIKKK